MEGNCQCLFEVLSQHLEANRLSPAAVQKFEPRLFQIQSINYQLATFG